MPGLWTGFQIRTNGTPSGTIAYWNNYNSITLGTTLSSCVYEDNTNSPVTLTMDGAYTGRTNGGVNADNGIFPAAVRVSSYYITSSGPMTWDFGGLTNGKTYEIRAIGSRTAGTGRTGDMTIGGTTLTIDANDGGAGEIVTFTGVSPSSGVIQASYTLGSGSSYAYINGFVIREEDAGGATGKKLFLGLAGVGF